ncbi:MAG: HAMP domain-containing histidine kinase [Acidimicrobiales bacterium]|nr:HAMP domain-containing histidine kinase [Acidimicrobiales bacterium]
MTGAEAGAARPVPRRRLRLRLRATVAFAIGALAVSLALSGLTYGLVRRYLLEQRESTATTQVYLNARLVRSSLLAGDTDVPALLASLATTLGSQPVLELDGDWFARVVNVGRDDLPGPLRATVLDGGASRQRFAAGGVPYLAVGVALPDADAAYFEAFPLTELERTLDTLRAALLVAATITTVAGAALGWYASRRVLRPLRDVADTAALIAEGDLSARIDEHGDADLDPLVRSFNDMASTLEGRLERDARFASDVSHELRSPLTAMRAAVEVVDARRDELPERVRVAVAVLRGQVRRFERMVLDLLEISRIDAGVVPVDLRPRNVAGFVRRVARGLLPDGPPVEVSPAAAEALALVDERRFERVLANLVENAQKHGGGVTRVAVDAGDGRVRVLVEDHGPGVPAEERSRIFERYARGDAARHQVGTGLGLALAAEHVRLHWGRVWVEDAPDGGARFVVELPKAVS